MITMYGSGMALWGFATWLEDIPVPFDGHRRGQPSSIASTATRLYCNHMTANGDRDTTAGDDRLAITRDMLINDRRCTLRITVVEGIAEVAFEAADTDSITVGNLRGSISLDDLIPVTRALNATLGSAAKALGLTSSKYAAELDEVRTSHPRAGLPWSADEDARLIDRYHGGASLLELSNELERNIGGVASRLKMHGFRLPTRRNDADPNLDYADISEPDPDWS